MDDQLVTITYRLAYHCKIIEKSVIESGSDFLLHSKKERNKEIFTIFLFCWEICTVFLAEDVKIVVFVLIDYLVDRYEMHLL